MQQFGFKVMQLVITSLATTVHIEKALPENLSALQEIAKALVATCLRAGAKNLLTRTGGPHIWAIE
jgi:hypothetical protein